MANMLTSGMCFTIVNLLMCCVWGGGAFVRLHASHCDVVVRVRLIYTGMIVAASASGFQYQLFGEQAGYADLTVSFVMILFIGLGMKRWRYGVPRDLIKRVWLTH